MSDRDPDRDPMIDKLLKKAQDLSVETVARIADADDGTTPAETVLLSAMTIGFLLGSSASTAADTMGVQGINQWLTTAFSTAGVFFGKEKGKMEVRFAFEVNEAPNPSS